MYYNQANKGQNCQSLEDKIFLSIEQLLRLSGYCGHLVSVCDEANKYCYKTFDGKIGTVNKSFIHDRINKP